MRVSEAMRERASVALGHAEGALQRSDPGSSGWAWPVALASAIDAQKDLALPMSAFFPPQDAGALSIAIQRVLSEEHSQERTLNLEQASERVEQTYALSRWAEHVYAAYSEIL